VCVYLCICLCTCKMLRTTLVCGMCVSADENAQEKRGRRGGGKCCKASRQVERVVARVVRELNKEKERTAAVFSPHLFRRLFPFSCSLSTARSDPQNAKVDAVAPFTQKQRSQVLQVTNTRMQRRKKTKEKRTQAKPQAVK
jgi:hypothetical protein